MQVGIHTNGDNPTMATTEIKVYMQPELAADVEDAADNRGISTSKWLREAARRQLQREINDE